MSSDDTTTNSTSQVDRRTFLAAGVAASAGGAFAWFAGRGAVALAGAAPDAASDPLLGNPLHAEFAEESQVNRLYSMFAAKAEQEKLPNVAELFRAVAEAERVHADTLVSVMKAVNSTAQNLADSSDYEAFLVVNLLPKSAAKAEKEHRLVAATTLKSFIGAGRTHTDVFASAAKAAKAGRDIAETRFSVCPKCGAVMIGDGPDACPVCSTPKGEFIIFDAGKNRAGPASRPEAAPPTP